MKTFFLIPYSLCKKIKPTASLLLTLFNIFSPVFGQNGIKGVVLDSISSQPVPFATVYINGTTTGTITNNEGLFEINNVPNSAEVIFSHISYYPKQIDLKTNNPQYLKVTLCAKKVNISEVVVEGDNRRRENINVFKDHFLGTDYWGLKAILRNDEVLMFKYNHTKISTLKAYTTAPLIIDLPKLGYILHVDLVDFYVRYSEIGAQCSFLAYYYFQPYKTKSDKEAKKIEINRQEAFNNSSQQFCRSLYKFNLEQDGYKLYERSTDETTNEYKLINIDSYLKPIENDEMEISGLKDKQFIVLYNSKKKKNSKNAYPLNNYKYKNSKIYFLKDTCTIRKNGTIPDNSIMFSGEISKKQVGSFLPDNYVPANLDQEEK